MSTTDTKLTSLIINKLTKTQYNSAVKDSSQLYICTDTDEVFLGTEQIGYGHELTGTVGSSSQPIYLNSGVLTACSKADMTSVGFPDYSSITSKTKGTEYTADTNGYLSGYCVSGNGQKNCYVYIDSIQVRPTTLVDVYQYECWWFPVKKGSTYSVSGNGAGGYSFIPAIGG